ncbi:MAG: hypothetical protein O3A25_13915 [Acidobacteria bacterium]|nr:hypothetical protein [Acidobacteriota bacterium]
MRIRFVVLSLMVAVFSFTLARPAAAQRTGQWGIGYSFLGSNDIAVESSGLPLGWAGNGAVDLSDNLSIAFDVSGNYSTADVCGGIASRGVATSLQKAECFGLGGFVAPATNQAFQGFSNNRAEAQWCSPTLTTCNVRAISVGGFAGPRFSFGDRGGVRPFVHVMGGVVRSVRKIAFFSHTSTNWAFMPGAGVDVPVDDNMGVRFQFDLRRVLFGDVPDSGAGLKTAGADYNEIRVAVALTFGVGG